MIPSKQVETQGKDYDFLSKPNFTGLVIYSSLEGEYIREEIYENGAIFGGKMLKPGTDNKECTKSGKGDGSPQNPFVLNTVVCTAHYDRRSGDDILRDWMDGNLSSNDKNNMTEITTSIANDPDIGGGGGGVETPTPETQYTITVKSIGCNNGVQQQIKVSKGSSKTITACSSYGDTCLFFSWEGSSGTCGTDPSYTISSVDSDMTLTARYVSAGDCYNIAKMLNNKTLRDGINTLMGMSQDIEHGFYISSTGEITFYDGTEGQVKPGGNITSFIIARWHSHTNGAIFPSDKDLVVFCDMIKNYAYDRISFTYGITNYTDLLIIRVKDKNLFNAFLNEHSSNGILNSKSITDFYADNYNYNIAGSNSENVILLEHFLNSIGLYCYWGIGGPSDDSGNKMFYWQQYNGTTFDKMDCYSSY